MREGWQVQLIIKWTSTLVLFSSNEDEKIYQKLFEESFPVFLLKPARGNMARTAENQLLFLKLKKKKAG